MKKYFITGLIILLPLAITIAVVAFIINFLTAPFIGAIEQLFEKGDWFMQHKALVLFALRVALLFALFFLTVALGFLARAIVFKSLLSLYDYIMHRIPIIKTIYKATQQVMKTIFGTTSRSFKQVVIVPFPMKGAHAIGLVSSPAPSICEKTLGTPLVTVFIPTTPNPTSGYLMMYREDEVVYLDMKIEEAFKYIISCGVITSDTGPPHEIS